LAVGCYGHFTSPLRRYADLVNLRQIKAFLKGQSFPHTAEEMGPLAESLNLAADQRKIERAQSFKDVVRRSANNALANEQLFRLADHELAQACKMAGGAEGLPESLSTELIRRLNGAILTDKVTDSMVLHLPRRLWPDDLKVAFSQWLHAAPTRSMHIIYHLEQTDTVKRLEVVAEGAGTSFVATVSATLPDGSRLEEIGYAGRKKDAEQRAATIFLCQMLELPFEPSARATASAAEQKPAIVGNPKGALLELFQKNSWPIPVFESLGKGPSHAMIFTATVTAMVRGKHINASAAGASNRKEAEALASMAMLKQLA
jgi:ribonuclease R